MQVRYAPKSRRGMKPALSWRRACYALVLATVPAAAGNGTIELPDTASGSPAHRISLRLHFVAPPGPEQIALAQRELTRANRILCDATDSQFRIQSVTASTGDAALNAADIWWFPHYGRANSGGLANFGDPMVIGLGADGTFEYENLAKNRGHVLLYGYEPYANPNQVAAGFTFEGSIIAHELAHAIFGIGDEYAEQGASVSGRCPSGPGFSDEPFVDVGAMVTLAPARYPAPAETHCSRAASNAIRPTRATLLPAADKPPISRVTPCPSLLPSNCEVARSSATTAGWT